MKVYALKNFNYNLSSSGGAFPTIANAFYDLFKDEVTKVYVYGAAWQKDFSIKHVRINYEDGIECLSGSKYIQSVIQDVVKQVIEDLVNENAVIFSGTPCQVDAIRKAIANTGTNSDKLLLIDLICHGTPKSDLWGDYLKLIESKYADPIKLIDFRGNSINGGRLCVTLDSGMIDYNNKYLKTYMKFFSCNYSLKSGCFGCRYRNSELMRPGDITIGDFWGINEIMKGYSDCGGVSLVLTHNSKGNKILNHASYAANNTLKLDECSNDSYLIYNPHLYKQTQKPQRYEEFWDDYGSMGIVDFHKKWSKDSFQYVVKRRVSDLTSKLGIKYKIKAILHWIKSSKTI